MRFLMVLTAWVVFVGGLFGYTTWRDAKVPVGGTEARMARASEGAYSLEITPTFSLEEDPFALQTGSGSASPLELRLNGRLLPVPVESVRRGQPLKLDGIEGVVVGNNEIHLKASPPIGDAVLDHCVRIRVLEKGVALADVTVWGSRGALVSGTVAFTITEEEAEHAH
ncbi:MAG: hypothetical protein VR65_18360 [Desulfobulbaceae bacterium BRH_c16a]|nr:MAG: hypothetical protein VR65_18360 [Desulfobulbaceae bacterium BRH_c16a]